MCSDPSNIGSLSESQDNVFGYELQQLLSADWRAASSISESELQAITTERRLSDDVLLIYQSYQR